MQRALLRTPLWRREIRRQAVGLAWRLLSRTAFAYRATVARKVRVVAVVGSYGKTTTTRAVAAVLGCDDKHRHPAHSIMKLHPTVRWAAMEVAISAPGQMAPYARMVRPQVVVVTSIGTEHRVMLKSAEGTRQEKAEMVRALGPEGVALLNGDDPNVRWMATQTQAAVRTFGFGPDNDVRATDIALDWPHGTRFTLHADGETRPVHLRLVGRHMLYPVLAAVSVALAEGVSLDRAVAVLEALPPGSNRVQPMALPSGAFLLRDNCKSSIETVDAALDLLAEIPATRKIVVLGDLEHSGTTLDEIYATYERLGGRVAEVAGRRRAGGLRQRRHRRPPTPVHPGCAGCRHARVGDRRDHHRARGGRRHRIPTSARATWCCSKEPANSVSTGSHSPLPAGASAATSSPAASGAAAPTVPCLNKAGTGAPCAPSKRPTRRRSSGRRSRANGSGSGGAGHSP